MGKRRKKTQNMSFAEGAHPMLEEDDATSLADYVRGASVSDYYDVVIDCVYFRAVKCLECLLERANDKMIKSALDNALSRPKKPDIISVLAAHATSDETLQYAKALGALCEDDVPAVLSRVRGSARLTGLLLCVCEQFDAPKSASALVHICDDEACVFTALHSGQFAPADSRVSKALDKAVREKYDAKTRGAVTLPEWIASFIS